MEGSFVVAYDKRNSTGSVVTNGELDALVWNLKLVLQNGLVDMDSDAISVSIIVENNTELRLSYNASLDDEADFSDIFTGQGVYGTTFINEIANDEILNSGEICRFFVRLDTTKFEIDANEEVIIMIISGAAMLKVFKTAPTGIQPGLNILR
ncbi:MAG: hypothetical protein GY870_05115 [archaeon]|nr:hypothetical protein [archaeon]